MPGYVDKSDELKQQGVSEILCVSVNDPFVMAAWAKDQKTSGKVRLLADPSAALTKALDLTVDIQPLGGVSIVYDSNQPINVITTFKQKKNFSHIFKEVFIGFS